MKDEPCTVRIALARADLYQQLPDGLGRDKFAKSVILQSNKHLR